MKFHSIQAFTCTRHSSVYINVQNMLLISHNLMFSWTVQLALVTPYAGIPLRQYRACSGMSFEWNYRCHWIT